MQERRRFIIHKIYTCENEDVSDCCEIKCTHIRDFENICTMQISIWYQTCSTWHSCDKLTFLFFFFFFSFSFSSVDVFSARFFHFFSFILCTTWSSNFFLIVVLLLLFCEINWFSSIWHLWPTFQQHACFDAFEAKLKHHKRIHFCHVTRGYHLSNFGLSHSLSLSFSLSLSLVSTQRNFKLL